MSPASRRGRQRPVIIVAALAVAAVLAYVFFSGHYNRKPVAVSDLNASGTPTTSMLSHSASPTPTPSATPSTSGSPAAMSSASPNWGPGLQGNGGASTMPQHTAELRAWSSAPIPALGWYVPTAHASGKGFGKYTTFSESYTVWGNPKYVQLYVQGDSRGITIYCEVKIDGVVKVSGHTTGPYGAFMCMA